MCLRKIIKKSLCFLITAILVTGSKADVTVPALFSDNMVLQRNINTPVWGWAEKGEEVTVAFGNQKTTAKAGENGKWKVNLAPLGAGGPYELKITGKNSIVINNVLVGEVWLCSGQSNMNIGLLYTENADREIEAMNYPDIRMFRVEHQSNPEPQVKIKNGSWLQCSPTSTENLFAVADRSAVAYYFGKKLHRDLDVPIGLIISSVGASVAEAWTSMETLKSNADFLPYIESWNKELASYSEKMKQFRKDFNSWAEKSGELKDSNLISQAPSMPSDPRLVPYWPSSLYNGMIAPLIPYAIRGTIWYQGESNWARGYQYRKLFPAMINDWRTKWGQGQFPFLYVQLPGYGFSPVEPSEDYWAEIREAQLMTLSVPNTAMAVTIDIGSHINIHPPNKQDVGKRLALAALAKVYGRKIVYSGPIYNFMKIKDDKIVVSFTHTADGLKTKNNEPLKSFAIAGRNRKFVWANAEIKKDKVVVWNRAITEPVAVRYGWSQYPACNLYNSENLPASPFRTDDWPGLTVNSKSAIIQKY